MNRHQLIGTALFVGAWVIYILLIIAFGDRGGLLAFLGLPIGIALGGMMIAGGAIFFTPLRKDEGEEGKEGHD